MKGSLNSRHIRITALWAFSEAFLGGLLHGFKVPFSGLILSAFAAICMAALAMKDHQRGNIIHATLLVLIVKATLSPHTPVTAYFAVSLQGLFGEMIFATGLSYSLSCYLNSLFALMQSAFQKLIILTVLFGTDIWKALNEFFTSVLKQFRIEGHNYSFGIIIIYLLIYFIAGLFAGRFSSRLKKLSKVELKGIAVNHSLASERKKKSRLSSPFFWMMIFISAMLMYDYLNDDLTILPDDRTLQLIVRSFILISVWYFILSPLLLHLFKQWLEKKKNAFAEETSAILLLLPDIRNIVVQCWSLSSDKKGPSRIAAFISITFAAILSVEK